MSDTARSTPGSRPIRETIGRSSKRGVAGVANVSLIHQIPTLMASPLGPGVGGRC